MPVKTLRRSRPAHIAVIGAVAASALSLASPARSATDAPLTMNATELTPQPDPSTSNNRMARAMGIFAKHGLKVAPGPKLGSGGPLRIEAVVTRNTDVATGDLIASLGAIYNGSPIKVIMVLTPHGDSEIWGRTKYKSMKDAVGQTWAIASLGGSMRFNDQLTVEGMGFAPNAFHWVAGFAGDGSRLQAVDTGRTQLATLQHLGAVLAKTKGYAANIHVLVPHTAKYTPPVPRIVVVAREDWIKSHEETATRYVEAMLDMNRQWEKDSNAWVDAANKIFSNSGLSKDQLTEAWREYRDGGYFSINGGVNLAATQTIMNLFFKLRKEGPNQYLKTAKDVYDTGPLKAALDKMGVVHEASGLQDVPDWYAGKGAAGK